MKNSPFKLNWEKEQNNDLALKFILFGISPFLGFVYSLWRLNTKSSYIILLLTGIFFGLAFSVNTDDVIDGARHRFYFELDYYISWSDFYDKLANYLSFDSNNKDIYRDIISFFTSRFTYNYHWFFFIVAIIYSYFSLRSLRYFTSLNCFNFSLPMLILLYLFLKEDIFQINGVRFWTAGWISIYAIFQIFVSNNKRYFLLLMITPVIHVAFGIVPLMAMLCFLYDRVVVFTGKDKFLYLIYFLSFIFSMFSISILQSISDYMPPVLNVLINSYTDTDYVNEINDFDRTLTGNYFKIAKHFLINLMVLILILNRASFLNIKNIKNLFYFIIIMLSFVNVFIFVPSLGERFFSFLLPFIAFTWAFIFRGKSYNLILFLVPVVFLRDIYVSFLLYDMVLDFSDIVSSPFYLFYYYLIEAGT